MLLSPEDRVSIAREWVERTVATYPLQTAGFLTSESDRFRNPVGYLLKGNLPQLLEELAGGADPARVRGLLESIVRMRAVQDFTPGEAVGFVTALKDILRRRGQLELLEPRIDGALAVAINLYSECRNRIDAIRAGEKMRMAYVGARLHAEVRT